MFLNQAYQILGVDSKTSIDVVRKRYKELAKIYHPDKQNGNEQLFIKINEAYETITNRSSSTSSKDKSFFAGFENIFKRNTSTTHKANTWCCKTTVNIEELYNNKIYTFKYERYENCQMCAGSGDQYKVYNKCPKCNGNGVIQYFFACEDCDDCKGLGHFPCVKCESCQGVGRKLSIETVQIVASEMYNNNCKMVYPGMGNEKIGHQIGDLEIEMEVTDVNKYEHKQHDLFTVIDITLVEYLFEECPILYLHLDNEYYEINVNHILFDTVYSLSNMGLRDKNGQRGKLFFQFKLIENKKKSYKSNTLHNEIEQYLEYAQKVHNGIKLTPLLVADCANMQIFNTLKQNAIKPRKETNTNNKKCIIC